MAITTLYFDESGHTGSNYLDPQQPVLVCGSLRADEESAKALRHKYFEGVQAVELSHSALSSKAQRQMIVNLVASEQALIAKSYKPFLLHKEFALVGKYVDLMIEPAFAQLGENLYKGGANVGLVNVIPVLLEGYYGEAAYKQFLSAFQAFMREPNIDTLASLEMSVNGFDKQEDTLGGLLRMPFSMFGAQLLGRVRKAFLDLTFTSAWTLAHYWRSEIDGDIAIIHDKTSALSRQLESFRLLTDPDQPHACGTLAGKQVPTNVPIQHVIFGESRNYFGLQIVDVLSGAYAAAARWMVLGKPANDWYSREIIEASGGALNVQDSIWPDPDALDLSKVEADQSTLADVDNVLGEIGRRSRPRHETE